MGMVLTVNEKVKRLNVITCCNCGKLIGTRENYFKVTTRLPEKEFSMSFCEHCHGLLWRKTYKAEK